MLYKQTFNLKSILFFILIIQFILIIINTQSITSASSLSKPRIGLYPKDNSQSTLPLRKIIINAKIQDGFSTVEMIQEYFNPCNKPLETTFLFPKDKDSVFTSFQAIKSNQTIIGKIEEKTKAKEIYKQNLEKGNTVAYAEINEATHDVLQIDVGNILPGEIIQIKFVYSEPVDIALNKFWRFTILSTLTPRYTPFQDTQTNLPNIQHQRESNDSYTWTINMELISSPNSPIEIIYSPSHSIIQTFNDDKTSAFISLDPNVKHVPNKDFVLYYKDQNINLPSGLVEKFNASELVSNHIPMDSIKKQNDYIALISFFPILNNFTDDQALEFLAQPDATLDQINSKSFEQDLRNSKGEFIFIADRSGSMDGARIENLKSALIQFLQILPKDSLFNIISFGFTYQIMYPESLPATDDNIQRTIETIQLFRADFGGTEILSAIKAATTLPLSPKYPRSILLLTDGDVTNANQIISYVDNNSEKIRYCTVGIGNGISPFLIESIANVGHCSYEYVKDGEDIGNKALNLLQSAISPYLGDFHITYNCKNPGCELDNENIGGPLSFLSNISLSNSNNKARKSIIKAVLPEKDKLSYILKNQLFKMWIFFDEEVITGQENLDITISYTNYFTNQTLSNTINLQFANANHGVKLHQLGYNDLNNQLMVKSILDHSLYDKIKEAIINDSLKYQILSEYTAFILVINEVINDTIVQRPIKVDIPSISSTDYERSNFGGPIHMNKMAKMAVPVREMHSSMPLGDGSALNKAPMIPLRNFAPTMNQPQQEHYHPISLEPQRDLCNGEWLDPKTLEKFGMVRVDSQHKDRTNEPNIEKKGNCDGSSGSIDSDECIKKLHTINDNPKKTEGIIAFVKNTFKDYTDILGSSNSSKMFIGLLSLLLLSILLVF